MNQYFDVIILGSGVIGCSAAYHMARKGAKVMVIERGTVGGQTSSLAAGMLASQEESPAADAFFQLCRANQALLRPLVDEIQQVSGINPEYEPCGVWRAAETEEEKKSLLEKIKWQRDLGLTVEWQEAGDVREIHPGLGECVGAFYSPGDGQIHNAAWVQALAEAGRRKGVRFLDQVPEVEFVRDGRRLAGVRTKEDLIAGDHVLVAAGAWSFLVLEPLQIVLPLEPEKGQLMVLGGVPRAFRGPVYAGSGYVIPQPDGRLTVGATHERVGFDTQPTLEGQRFLADWATRWCPTLRSLPRVEFQAGLRPGTADGWPVMGRLWDYDNLSLATGHYRNGILLSPITGKYMADGILEGRWDPIGAPFTPDRFRPKPSGTTAG